MRIAYILTCLGIGGAERQVVALAECMAARGHTVVLLSIRTPRIHEWPTRVDIKYLNFTRSPRSILAGCWRTARFIRSFDPDLIHGHSFHGNLLARLLKFVVPGVRVISTHHNVFEGGRLRMLADRLTDALADGTTAVSEAVAERFIQGKVVTREKCRVIPNAFDLAQFACSQTVRAEMRTAMGAGEDFIWLAAGRIVPAKDFPNMLAAFQRVRSDSPQAQLWIAGEPMEDDRAASFGFSHGAEHHVHWLGLRSDMSALLDAADGFVLSSAWEGMPLAVGEAMAMEKPVVATDVGGVRELMGETNWIVRAKDAQALAGAMLTVMHASLEERQARGRAARQRIGAGFSMEARAEHWNAYYEAILK